MANNYQLNYASGRPQMYDVASREQKGVRIVKTLESYFGRHRLKKMTVLDVGASTGIIDNILAREFKEVVGIDIDEEAINYAQINFRQRNLKFKIGDVMKLDFPKNSFGVVVSAHVYEHVPDPKKLFSEIYRVLKPGGMCYLAAVNALWPWEPHYDLPFLSWLPKSLGNLYVRLTGKARVYYETPHNYWQLRAMIKDAGFKIYEYTDKIIDDPEKFGYPRNWSFLRPVSFFVKFLSPTLFWLIEK